MTPKKIRYCTNGCGKNRIRKKSLSPLGGQTGSGHGHVTISNESYEAFFEIAFGPGNVCQCKMTKNFALYACTRQPKTLLRSRRLLNSSTVVYQILYISRPQSFMRGRSIDQSSDGGSGRPAFGGPALSQTDVGNLLRPSPAFRLRSRSVYIQF